MNPNLKLHDIYGQLCRNITFVFAQGVKKKRKKTAQRTFDM